MLPGTIIVLFFCASCAKASTARSATFSCTACSPPGWRIAAAILRMASARGLGHRDDRGRLALGLVDLGLLLAFGAGDEGLALAGGDVDLLLAPAFGGGDQRALLALGGDLRLHRVQDLRGRRQVLDLVAQHLHAPVQRRLVEALTTCALMMSRSSKVLSSSILPITLRSEVCASWVMATM